MGYTMADLCDGISIHAPHEGERRWPTGGLRAQADFNPRSPRGGATRAEKPLSASPGNFNPRSPRGGATESKDAVENFGQISIHAPHEGERRGCAPMRISSVPHISIHAPHEGERRVWLVGNSGISIHAPHEGERPDLKHHGLRDIVFQSTLPTRGSDAKILTAYKEIGKAFQSTLPTRGSDLRRLWTLTTSRHISIHAPHEGERP